MTGEWLSPTEAARLLGIHRVTLYRYVRDHRVTGYRNGLRRGLRFLRRDIEALTIMRPSNIPAPSV